MGHGGGGDCQQCHQERVSLFSHKPSSKSETKYRKLFAVGYAKKLHLDAGLFRAGHNFKSSIPSPSLESSFSWHFQALEKIAVI
jgi:hypothetical protein